jgi:hypothetical protein
MPTEVQSFLIAVGAFSSLLALVLSVCAAAMAAYFGPYLKKKAEMKAKLEDQLPYLEHLVEETRAIEVAKTEVNTPAQLRIETRKSALAADTAERIERLKGEVTNNLEILRTRAQAEIGHLAQIFTPRLLAYRKAWELAYPLRFGNPIELTRQVREAVSGDMTNWYYLDAGGLFLSQEGTYRWLNARAKLLDDSASDDDIRRAFSGLREQLKNDIGVYGSALKRDVSISPGAVTPQSDA